MDGSDGDGSSMARMRRSEIGKLHLEIDPEALKSIISEGRLREFTAVLASHAAAQISAQVVDAVADMAVGGGGAGVSASFVLEEGDFGTVPPRPKFGIGSLVRYDMLQRVALAEMEQVLHG